MSKFLHADNNDHAKAIARPQVFSKNSWAKIDLYLPFLSRFCLELNTIHFFPNFFDMRPKETDTCAVFVCPQVNNWGRFNWKKRRKQVKVLLTLYSIDTRFGVSATVSFWKHCASATVSFWKHCTSNFFFSHNVFYPIISFCSYFWHRIFIWCWYLKSLKLEHQVKA